MLITNYYNMFNLKYIHFTSMNSTNFTNIEDMLKASKIKPLLNVERKSKINFEIPSVKLSSH